MTEKQILIDITAKIDDIKVDTTYEDAYAAFTQVMKDFDIPRLDRIDIHSSRHSPTYRVFESAFEYAFRQQEEINRIMFRIREQCAEHKKNKEEKENV
jgi:hypothetical protein